MYVSVQGNIIRKESVMLAIPSAAYSIFMSFSIAFTKPTFQRILPLAVGALLTRGRQTITNILWTMRGLVPGHSSTYHRVFSRASWSLWPLGKTLATAILRLIPVDEPILVPMDDTTAQHRGKCVYGKGCHHDAVRSAHKHVVFRWGHRWIVLAISIKFPFTSRYWALPVLVALYRPEDLDAEEGRQHKTAPHLARQMMAILIHWFPERKFVFLGDGAMPRTIWLASVIVIGSMLRWLVVFMQMPVFTPCLPSLEDPWADHVRRVAGCQHRHRS